MTYDAIADVLRICRRTWRAFGVPDAAAEEMAAELAADLAAAAADGQVPGAVVGHDVPAFAREWAAARGFETSRPRWGLVLAAAFGGMVVGAGIGDAAARVVGFVLYVVARREPTEILAWYAVIAVGAYCGAVAAVAAALWRVHDTRWRETARTLAVYLPGAAVVATALGIGWAAANSFSDSPAVAISDVALVATVLGTAVVYSRLAAIRRTG